MTLRIADAQYVLDAPLASGGMGVTFAASSIGEDDSRTVVIKLVLPKAWLKSRATAELAFKKELECLQRLSRQQPISPHVVSLLGVGELTLSHAGSQLTLPWLALEHVSSHAQGNTIQQRIHFAIAERGHAWSSGRTARAVAQLAEGLEAISAVGVVHRDISPANVLVAGDPADETLKITDFGLSRAQGMPGTFGHKALGTPGYAAPEQLLRDWARVGPASDVFALAATTFFMLSGAHLLPESFVETIDWLQRGRRRLLLDSPHLSPELRARPEICARLDAVLVSATELDPVDRPQLASALKLAILPLLAD